jgi:hypothetical protein
MTTPGTGTGFESGVQLGVWLESEVRPLLKRWGRSGDKRVYLSARILSAQIEAAASKQDWAALAELRETWRDAENGPEVNGGPSA